MNTVHKKTKKPPKKIYIFQQIELNLNGKLQQLPDKYTDISGIREIVQKNIRIITDGILVPFYFVIYLICFMGRGLRQKIT